MKPMMAVIANVASVSGDSLATFGRRHNQNEEAIAPENTIQPRTTWTQCEVAGLPTVAAMRIPNLGLGAIHPNMSGNANTPTIATTAYSKIRAPITEVWSVLASANGRGLGNQGWAS